MEPDSDIQLPFVTRDMLRFKHGAKFELVVSALSTLSVPIICSGYTREGPFTFTIPLTADADFASVTLAIPDFPIAVGLNYAYGTTAYFGDFFGSISLKLNGDTSIVLCSGYFGPGIGISYPSNTTPDPTLGQGRLKAVYLDNPAAGAQASYVIPGHEKWKIIGGTIELVTSAAAANRRLHWKIGIGIHEFFDFFSNVDQAASLTRKYTLASVPSTLTQSDDNDIIIPIPPNLFLPPATTFKTTISNGQAGDDLGQTKLIVESFLESGH
jgi:hypothetical protein